jgi:DNA-directed RNA polymerase subunit E'/Rpb7
VGGDVSVNSDTLLMTDFVNLKIKSAQSFGGTYRGRMCILMFICVSVHTYMNIYVYTIFFKKIIAYFTVRYNILFDWFGWRSTAAGRR